MHNVVKNRIFTLLIVTGTLLSIPASFAACNAADGTKVVIKKPVTNQNLTLSKLFDTTSPDLDAVIVELIKNGEVSGGEWEVEPFYVYETTNKRYALVANKDDGWPPFSALGNGTIIKYGSTAENCEDAVTPKIFFKSTARMNPNNTNSEQLWFKYIIGTAVQTDNSVSGYFYNTDAQIQAKALYAGIPDPDTKVAVCMSKIDYAFSFFFEGNPQKYTINMDSVHLTCSANIFLGSSVNKKDENLQSVIFMQGVVLHEIGHYEMAVELRDKMHDDFFSEIAGIGSVDSENELNRRVKAVFNQVKRAYDADGNFVWDNNLYNGDVEAGADAYTDATLISNSEKDWRREGGQWN